MVEFRLETYIIFRFVASQALDEASVLDDGQQDRCEKRTLRQCRECGHALFSLNF